MARSVYDLKDRPPKAPRTSTEVRAINCAIARLPRHVIGRPRKAAGMPGLNDEHRRMAHHASVERLHFALCNQLHSRHSDGTSSCNQSHDPSELHHIRDGQSTHHYLRRAHRFVLPAPAAGNGGFYELVDIRWLRGFQRPIWKDTSLRVDRLRCACRRPTRPERRSNPSQ
jgi:hypothetical protein